MLITIPEFQRFQHVFTAHIRNPKVDARPNGIEARRTRIYNELVYNNTESALLICFPVLKKVLGRQLWARLLRAFIAKHRRYAPFFTRYPTNSFNSCRQSGHQPQITPNSYWNFHTMNGQSWRYPFQRVRLTGIGLIVPVIYSSSARF